MNIREKTVLIIQRENEYLVGRIIGSRDLRWSGSPWDAWTTRNKEDAERVAGMVGGQHREKTQGQTALIGTARTVTSSEMV